jgi:hypothetical protein
MMRKMMRRTLLDHAIYCLLGDPDGKFLIIPMTKEKKLLIMDFLGKHQSHAEAKHSSWPQT